MNDWIGLVIVIIAIASHMIGYFMGLSSGMKDVEIAKVKAERDMFETRLIEWNKNQKNI